MKSPTESLEHASVRQYCKAVRVPAEICGACAKSNSSNVFIRGSCASRIRLLIAWRSRSFAFHRQQGFQVPDMTVVLLHGLFRQ